MAGWLERVAALGGWRRWLAAAGFGLVLGLAFAPLRWSVLILPAYLGLAVLLEGSLGAVRPRRSAFLTGQVFGTAFFALTTAWLGNAFLVQADAYGWMIPVILPAFFLGMGVFFGMAALLATIVRQRLPLDGMAAFLPLVVSLSIFEWLRGHILTGFPWNLTAQAFAGHTVTLQPLAVLGPYGYGLVLLLAAVLPAAWLKSAAAGRRGILLTAGMTALILAYGTIRLAILPAEDREDASVVVVQPNIPQRDKLDPAKQRASLVANIENSATAATSGRGAVYVVWPENAFPMLARIPELGPVLGRTLPEGAYLVSGSIRRVPEGWANTLQVFAGVEDETRDALLASYDKHRLVPFGETLPFANLFIALGIESLSPAGGGGFVPGTGPVRLDYGPAAFAPLICYEDVFPGALYPAGERPDWLVVVTNDAWFGDAAGPKQHLDIARMRAVETGLPLARSANTGISALIDAEGRLRATLPLYEQGTLTLALPKSRPATVYARLGDILYLLILALIALIVAGRGLQHRIAPLNLVKTR
jgi:apolipoprotein N-acyltransferase